MSEASKRPIAEDNPNTVSVLVRVTPALRDSLDAWLSEVNAAVVGPRWSRTDLLREALSYVARTRPKLGVAAPPEGPAEQPPSPPVKAPKPAPKVTGTLDEKALRKRAQAVRGYTKLLGQYLGLAPQTIHGWATQSRKHSWEPERLQRVSQWLSENESSG